jgi:IS30 family transposase
METSPRTGINASRNRPYSPDTVETYRGYYNTHIKGDPFTLLKMAEVEEEDTVDKINNRPRKVLGYLTPYEVFPP